MLWRAICEDCQIVQSIRFEWQYLVSIGMHATENRRPSILLYVDLALPDIVARNEEGGLGFVCCKYIEDVVREVVRTVVEGQSHFAFDRTVIDSIPTVCDVADKWSG